MQFALVVNKCTVQFALVECTSTLYLFWWEVGELCTCSSGEYVYSAFTLVANK